ncbi:MAG TPA: ATP-binding protein, partial [Pyrinomonadaceae bacterium]|nr:ATP-binding protein [Pyrinomonadaceae bacterium]
MSSVDENTISANTIQMHQMQSLIIGRLIVCFLLLVTSWVWYSGYVDLTFSDLPNSPFLIFIITVGLTAVYFLIARLNKNFPLQVRAQFLIDAFLITWLVWRTGDLTSPYITLFIVLIGVSSQYLNPRATITMAFISVGLFSLVAILTGISLSERHGTSMTLSKLIQISSFHIVAFLVVGLLASRLSERKRSGDELAEATRSLASLRMLHERIIESIRSGLITTDLEGTIYIFNAAASEITGHSSEEMVGRSAFLLFEDLRESIDLTLDASVGGEQLPRFESDFTTAMGSTARLGYNISQLFSETGETTGYVITFQDLTEIRSMEESIKRKDRLAAVGRVGAGLAHEIRNPLGAMRGAIQILESTTPPGSIHADLMGIILRESDRLNSIITNFLSYAKPKVGSFVDTDICEAIRDTLTLLRLGPDVHGGHHIEEDLPPSPLFITADATQLKQVFWNLARNAVNAMPDGGTLTIRTEQLGGNRVRIVFEDTGMGMKPEQVERLFEPFATSTSGGTGLGLSIVYQIIRDHKGVMNVRSIEGEGTVITIDLPREQPRPQEPDNRESLPA